MINQLIVSNFRGFTDLRLDNLKRLNLIVGQNNAGKTSLLEAIFLLCEPNRVNELPGLFRALQGNNELRYFRWLLRDGAEGSRGNLRRQDETGFRNIFLGLPDALDAKQMQHHQRIYTGKFFAAFTDRLDEPKVPCRTISVQHREATILVLLVGRAQRKRFGEETLQKLLAAVDPRIKKVRVDPGEDGNQVIVDIGLSELIPISQAGQGVYRLVSILADLIGDTPAVLLIDELENGLHHSIYETIWQGLAETAKELNVQIFATTHSDELFRAGHRAFLTRDEYDFGVIQLFRVDSGVQGRLLDKEHIEAAIAGNIDLR
jgi:predicted ATPase